MQIKSGEDVIRIRDLLTASQARLTNYPLKTSDLYS